MSTFGDSSSQTEGFLLKLTDFICSRIIMELPAIAFSTPSDFGGRGGDVSKGEFAEHHDSSLWPDKVYRL